MSASRKEFDVKQILRIRWRWFGHPTSSAPHNQSLGDFFSGRGNGGSADGPRSALLPASASGCRRSLSQQDCRSPPPLQWVAHPQPKPEVLEETAGGCAGSQQALMEGREPEGFAGGEANSGNLESDSSSCRLVLSSVSDYFAAMFTSNVREATQEEVKMEGVDPDALWALVQYAYTGRLQLREDTIESLLAASCLLQLSTVVQACCNFLVKQLHPSNCLGIRSFADAQGCQELHKVAHSYTMEHFLEVMRNQEFQLLPPGEVEKLLLSDDMNVPDEETAMGALLSWVQYDCAARQCCLPRLLAHVRLPLLSPQFLADVESSPLLRDSVDCQHLLMEAMKYHLLPERRSLLQSPRTRPRKATVGTLFAVGGMDATKGATSIEQYCLRKDSWRQVAVMSGRRLQFGVAVLEGRLYVVGGRDGLKTLNTVECYNPQSRSWSVMPPMSTHRHAPCASLPADAMCPRAGVAVLGGPMLYAVGGRDGSSCLRSVECFDPHTNKWSVCGQMAKRRGGVGVATWNNFLYAIGGHDAPASSLTSRLSDCVERYDPKTDTWTTVAPMSISRDAVGVCLLGDRLYAVGGYDGQVYLNTVEAYDPQTNQWEQVAPLCVGRAGACVVVVKL
uniref:Kelch-like family member 5 n=1 Tax=Paramormyrops kingsleyae TaxID=1676925 RepID=A0A3B3RLP9_9TELE